MESFSLLLGSLPKIIHPWRQKKDLPPLITQNLHPYRFSRQTILLLVEKESLFPIYPCPPPPLLYG